MANRAYETIDIETLEVLKEDTLDQIRRVSGVGSSHSINGRSINLPSRSELLDQLADINSAITRLRAEAQGLARGPLRSSYADFRRR